MGHLSWTRYPGYPAGTLRPFGRAAPYTIGWQQASPAGPAGALSTPSSAAAPWRPHPTPPHTASTGVRGAARGVSQDATPATPRHGIRSRHRRDAARPTPRGLAGGARRASATVAPPFKI